MTRIAVLLILGYAFSVCFGMRETCTNEQFSYINRQQFHSVKADGRHYSCLCSGRRCSEIRCTLLSGPTETPPPQEEDVITGEVGETTGDSSEEVLIPTVIAGGDFSQTGNSDGCYDAERRRTIPRGQGYTEIQNRIRRSCSCPESGSNEIQCEIARCEMPESPTRSIPVMRDEYGCFDSWNNQQYNNGAVYNRTRYMDMGRSIVGTYRCTCSRNMMRCSAIDIPCCDLSTGEFVTSGSLFTTLHSGQVMQCTCRGQRGRYSNCYSVGSNSGRYPTYPNRFRPRPRPRPQPRQDSAVCIDRRTNMRYPVGRTWTQNRKQRGLWDCECRRTSYSTRAICKYRVNQRGYRYGPYN